VPLAACGRSSPSPVDKVADARRAEAVQAARQAGLDAAVQAFLGRAAAAVGRSFTVTYQGPGASRTTLVQQPPDRRIDVADGGTESLFRLTSGTFACRRDAGPSAKWTCRKQATSSAGGSAAGADPDLGVFSTAQLSATVEALAAARSAYRITVASRRLAGTTATCLVATATAKATASVKASADELCIAPDGAILRIHTAQQSLEALHYHAGADRAALRLPAPAG